MVLLEIDVNADWLRPARKVSGPMVILTLTPQFFLACMVSVKEAAPVARVCGTVLETVASVLP